MTKFELRVPPVVVWLVLGLLMLWGARTAPSLRFSWPHQNVIALGLFIGGGVIAVLGVISFRRAKTTVNPLHPENMSALVVGGIYRFTRNPMYLGIFVTLMGWSVWLANVVPWLFLPIFILYLNRFQIIPEERALASMFGADFTAYRTRVRRWL